MQKTFENKFKPIFVSLSINNNHAIESRYNFVVIVKMFVSVQVTTPRVHIRFPGT